jgi:hypothetical protein
VLEMARRRSRPDMTGSSPDSSNRSWVPCGILSACRITT